MTKIAVYTVDKSVPLPAGGGGIPFRRLLVGESIAFDVKQLQSIRSMAYYEKKRSGRTFTVRKIDDKTARIWRIK